MRIRKEGVRLNKTPTFLRMFNTPGLRHALFDVTKLKAINKKKTAGRYKLALLVFPDLTGEDEEVAEEPMIEVKETAQGDF